MFELKVNNIHNYFKIRFLGAIQSTHVNFSVFVPDLKKTIFY